jgi:hypothetical protein
VAAGLLYFCGIAPAYAANRIIGLDALGIEQDVRVAAPHSSITLNYPLPRLARLKSATAAIYLTPNSQLSGETVFFFYYNDKLVGTRTAKSLRQEKPYVIKLPVDGAKRDFVQLKIKAAMFISDDQCRDYQSGGLFYTVHPHTALRISYDMPPIHKVADFFDSFQQALLVVVPDNAAMEEYTPGAWVYGLLKKAYPHLSIQFVHAAELSKLPPVPRIWVGVSSRLPNYFKGAAEGIALVDPNTLLISATDVANLRIYAQQLLAMSSLALYPASSKRVEISPVESLSGKATEAISFGSDNFNEGLLSVPVEFQIFPALLEKIPERMGLHLEGSYTVSLGTEQPVRMNVFLNNKLVHSSALDKTGSFKKDISLQERLEPKTLSRLKIQFDYPKEPGLCKVRGKFQTVQILPGSFLWGAGLYRVNHFSWSNIGLFLARKGTVLLDETMGIDALKSAGEAVYFINSQLPPGEVAFPGFLPLQQQVAVKDGAYVLVVGLAENIPVTIQELAPVSIGKDLSVYRKAAQTLLFEHRGSVSAVVGSIGKFKNAPLIIISANMSGRILPEALRQLSRRSNYEALNGNVLIYQQPSRLYAFDVREQNPKTEKPAADEKPIFQWLFSPTLVMIAIGILVLLILAILVIRKMFPRRKSRREADGSESSKGSLFK